MTSSLPVFGPTKVFAEEDSAPDVVVRVAFALSRVQLLTALSVGFTEISPGRDARNLTVDEVRVEVEGWLHAAAVMELDRYVTQGQLSAYPPEQQTVMDALGVALNRAYPPVTERAETVADLPPVQQPRYGVGTVTLQTLDHGEITIEEPAWCQGHAGEQLVKRVDVTHIGRTITAEVETDTGPVEFLPARIVWGPFAEARPELYPSVDVDDFPAMDPERLREFAAETALHAGRLYRLANELYLLRRGES